MTALKAGQLPLKLEALEALADSLGQGDLEGLFADTSIAPDLRAAALRILGLRFPEALASFKEGARDPAKKVRVAAIEALGQISLTPQNVGPISDLLASALQGKEVREVVSAAANVIGRQKLSGAYGLLTTAFEANHRDSFFVGMLDGMVTLGDPRVVDFLAKTLPSSIPGVRSSIATALAGFPVQQAEPVLVGALFAEPGRKDFAYGGYAAAKGEMKALNKLHTPGARAALEKIAAGEMTEDLMMLARSLLSQW
jgi:hypothetical protein